MSTPKIERILKVIDCDNGEELKPIRARDIEQEMERLLKTWADVTECSQGDICVSNNCFILGDAR
jgi:hypothetical protein